MNSSEQERLILWLSKHDLLDVENIELDKITRLDLSGHLLEELPEEIGILSNLVTLNLSGNRLKTIPDSFKNLKKLSSLDIRRNEFKRLPSVLKDLNLRSLNASGNQLEDISALNNSSSLRVLDLSNNSLNSLIDSLPIENELRNINLSSNFLKDMSKTFVYFSKVERINLDNNLIEEIPKSIAKLKYLKELNITDNHLEKIDELFFDLPLEKVDLSSNRLTKLSLHKLINLEEMTLDNNPFEELYIHNNFAPKLTEFSCENCLLKEFLLPSSEHIKSLCYSCNEIEIIPDDIGKYKYLYELDIDENKISNLPDTLANLSYLRVLYIDANPLTKKAKKVISVLEPEICDLNMKSNISIQKAQESDLVEMAELLSVLFEIERDFNIDFDKQYSGIRSLYLNDGSDLLVAKHENSVVGMITMQRLISSAEGDFIGQIEDLVVKHDYRKMGVGSRLLNKMRNIAQEYKYKRIQLAADIDNANALQFYNRRGFRRTNLSIYHYK